MPSRPSFLSFVCGVLTLVSAAHCGEAPKVSLTDAAPSHAEPLLRKPPKIASTIYDVDCQMDADCVLVPEGDVCRCAGFGAMRRDNEESFLLRRGRLAARCPDSVAAACRPDPALQQARCIAQQCVARSPRALQCVDTVLPNIWPLTLELGQGALQPADEVADAAPASDTAPQGDAQTFLLHPQQAGKYRIVLTGGGAELGRSRWLVVRTPDCQSDNVAYRMCQGATERCQIDEVLGAGDTAVIVVRNCDANCRLQVGQFDPARPLVPPL